MMELLITCPHCNRKFPLSEAMRHEIEERVESDHKKKLDELNADFQQQITEAKKEAAKQAAKKVKDEASVEIDDLKNQVKELSDKTAEFTQKELNFLKKERRN